MKELSSNFENKNSKIKDKEFLDDYWERYKKILFDSRNDSSILILQMPYMKHTLIKVN